RPAHTCAISLLAIPKTWSQDWRFLSLPDLFEFSWLQVPKQTLPTKEDSEKPLSSVSNTYPGAPQPALLRILGDRSPQYIYIYTHTHTHTHI
ncbi:unnamed protein product, partial [Staurois parvus]